MPGKDGKFLYDRLEPTGRVTLVGAGPGAADLITVRGQRALVEADVVVYDDLANSELLELCPPEAVRIHVGKRAGRHSMPQAEIGEILVREARKELRVVRLKGGDPLIFGRGGEEAQVLVEAGIPFEIVPGVTAAAAAGAVAGIPLTQRGFSSAVVFVTGHECREKSPETAVDWRALARTKATLCIYMGSRRIGTIAAELRAGGLADDTPVAVVTDATLPHQTVQIADLISVATLAEDVIGRPALIIVGEVVRLAEILSQARAQLETLSA